MRRGGSARNSPTPANTASATEKISAVKPPRNRVSYLYCDQLKVDGDRRVLATWRFPQGHNPEPEGVSEVLRCMSEEILEVTLLGGEESS